MAGKRQGDSFRSDRTGSIQVGNNELCKYVMSLFPSPSAIATHYVPQALLVFPCTSIAHNPVIDTG